MVVSMRQLLNNMKKTNEDKIIETLDKIVVLLQGKSAPSDDLKASNGLMWSNSIGEDLNWEESKQFAKNCRDGGYDDWRLPTVSELQNVFDYDKGEPRIQGFIKDFFWSSTELSDNPTYAWVVLLGSGFTCVNTKVTATYDVRCVRRD